MPRKYPHLTFTDSVKDAQRHYGSRKAGEMLERFELDDSNIGPRESEFIAERDGFYISTVSENGWPYVQFRGGPKGFLKVLDNQTLAYVDYGGNRQYITTGNLRANARAALMLMDYADQRRMKIMARTEVLDASEDLDLVAQLHDPAYPATVERIVRFHVEAFDWNCPQHIIRKFNAEEFAEREAALVERIQELEARLNAES